MSETTLTKSKRKTASDYEAIAAQLVVEMNRLKMQMDKDRSESQRLKTETQVIKAETEIIKARTASTISQLLHHINSLTSVR